MELSSFTVRMVFIMPGYTLAKKKIKLHGHLIEVRVEKTIEQRHKFGKGSTVTERVFSRIIKKRGKDGAKN